jgi:GNAT superfamily N-acetyltransferase
VPTLVAHRRRMWEAIGGRSRGELDRADPIYRDWVEREARAGRFVAFLVEERGGRVLGSGAVWLSPAQPRPGRLARETMPYILSMFTEPDARGRGVASRIVRAMIAWSSRRGYRRIFLHASEQGRPVYTRLGFELGNEMRLDLPARRAK